MKTKKLTVTIGICAYNSQELIGELLTSVFKQNKKGYILKEVIVHCDSSGDNSSNITKAWAKKTKRTGLITILEPKKRLGFAGSFKKILDSTNTDLVIVLNDDIKIRDQKFISKIVKATSKSNNFGLASVNLKQLPPRSFIEKSITISIKAFEEARESKADGNNLFSCDGKVLILSKRFYKNVGFPKNLSLTGNMDAFLYFACLIKGFNYLFLSNVSVYHHNPKTLKEYVSWTSRNNSNHHLLRKTFGKIVDREFQLPDGILLQKKLSQFLHYPIHCLFLLFASVYIKFLASREADNFNPLWETLPTTKFIN